MGTLGYNNHSADQDLYNQYTSKKYIQPPKGNKGIIKLSCIVLRSIYILFAKLLWG